MHSLLFSASLAPEGREPDPFDSAVMLADQNFEEPLSSAETQAADNLLIQLATMGKGDPLYVWFGHSGLVVTDLRNNRKVMYDYGVFSFDNDFYRTFIMGRMFYQVWATSAEARFAQAREEDRDLRLITLDLPPEGKLALVKFLNYNILPENQTYLYHHYRENCSTRIRDIIDKAVGGQFSAWAKSIPSQQTLRQHVMRHTSDSPFIDWVLNFLQSGRIDHPITLWEEMFLPEMLEKALLQFSYTDSSGKEVPIVSGSEVLNVESPAAGRTPVLGTWHSMTGWGFVFGLAIGLISLMLRTGFLTSDFTTIRRISHVLLGIINWSWTLVTGICSSVLLFMMVFTSHDVTYANENILFVSPWMLVMSVWSLQMLFGNRKALVRFRKSCSFFTIATVVLIILKCVYPDFLIQQNWQIICTMLPIYLLNSNFSFERIKALFARVDAGETEHGQENEEHLGIT